MRRAQVHFGQLGVGEADVLSDRVEEDRPLQLGLAQLRAVEAGAGEIRLDGRGHLQVRVREVGPLAIGGVQGRLPQDGADELGAPQVGAGEVGPFRFAPAKFAFGKEPRASETPSKSERERSAPSNGRPPS